MVLLTPQMVVFFQEDKIPVILEVKNDNEGNAFKQVCDIIGNGLKENYVRITRLPYLLLCLTASHLGIADAFYNGDYLIEGLIRLFESTEPKRTNNWKDVACF
ncbi:2090_t:CDS:2 [Funneliformis caledonium]|uniref:2090_t:CDS:1 n=1 Tax=Funneliformis caledonium TaxID=1117310 RepID=A0A9N8WQS8_9GLOM|nr:2090_t:CDS:2 [Funneliformis caledonium]